MDYTLTFKDGQVPEARGWTSFHSFIPDGMVKLRNKLFSFKDGQLYKHHSTNVNRNNYYGTDYNSKISVMMNQSPSEIKNMKTLSQEGTRPWSATVQAFESDQEEYRQTTLASTLFQEKEGQWHSHLRRAESTGTVEGTSALYGIGTSTTVLDPNVTIGGLSRVPSTLMIGDSVYKEGDILLGTVSAKTITNGAVVITIDDAVVGDFTQLINGDFIYGKKDLRIDGSALRGYVFRVDLEDNSTTRTELFGIAADVSKSYQ